jgi:hypothetical protein
VHADAVKEGFLSRAMDLDPRVLGVCASLQEDATDKVDWCIPPLEGVVRLGPSDGGGERF